MKHTYIEIANSFELWGEHVDPDATMSREQREQFDAMSLDDKITVLNSTFGYENDFGKAIADLVNGRGDRHYNVMIVYGSVEDFCQTETDDGETSLFDWLDAGVFHLSDTPESIAADWDSSDDGC